MSANYVVTSMGSVIHLDGRPLSFTQEDFDCFVLALQRTCRFNGLPISRFYSVLEHQILCYDIARALFPDDAGTPIKSLVHDMHEAVVGDIITPVKHILAQTVEYQSLESNLDSAILSTVNSLLREGNILAMPIMTSKVKQVDTIAFYMEVVKLVHPSLWHLFADTETMVASLSLSELISVNFSDTEPDGQSLISAFWERFYWSQNEV